MKKRISIIVIVAILTLLTVFTLTACDGGKKKNDGKLVLKNGMTGAEIFVALTNANIDSMTRISTRQFTDYRGDVTEVYTSKATHYYNYSEVTVNGELTQKYYEFYEDGRYYSFSYDFANETWNHEITDYQNNKLDMAEMDFVLSSFNFESIADMVNVILDNKDRVSEDSSIKVENNDSVVIDSGDGYSTVLKDFNNTTVTIPAELGDYKSLAANKELGGYDRYDSSLADDEIGCYGVQGHVVTFTVPSTVNYEGKTYKVVKAQVSYVMEEMTLPTSIRTLEIDPAFVGQIVYKGTIAQWNEIEFTAYPRAAVKVRCSDGDTTIVAPKKGE